MGKILLLRLEGALQSWGDHAKWDVRDSGDFPSKSGVAGLLACALGLERGDPDIADLSAHLRMAVRADRPGVRMRDFHTVQGRPLYNAEGNRGRAIRSSPPDGISRTPASWWRWRQRMNGWSESRRP